MILTHIEKAINQFRGVSINFFVCMCNMRLSPCSGPAIYESKVVGLNPAADNDVVLLFFS